MSQPPRLLQRLNLRKNVLFAVSEFVINAVLLFVGYRLLIKQGGLEAVGVWSALYAWTNLIRLGDAGVATAATRFLALWDLADERERIRTYAETALLVSLVQFGMLALLAYAGISSFVEPIVGAAHAEEAKAVLPWLLLGFFLLNVAGTVLGSLQGLHMGYRRSQLSVAGTTVQLLAVLALVPSQGLMGLAWGQVLQHSFVAVVGWWLVRRAIGGGFLPCRFEGSAFRAMLGYSIKAQVVNIANGLVEPVSKILVGNFGGMGTQGLYELAYKTVLLPRNVVASAVTAMTPAFTTLYQNDRRELRKLYGRVFRFSAWIMAAGSVAVVVLAPIASTVWLQRTDTTYWLYVALLAVAFYFNVLGIPGYLLGMASGKVRNNIIATVLTLAALTIFGLAAGSSLGGTATVAASAIAVGACGIAVWLTNRHLLSPWGNRG